LVRVAQAYGQWLHFLMRHHWLDPDAAPCQRATETNLTAYFNEMSDRLASVSVASSLRDLSEALRVMQPEGVRDLAQELAAYAHSIARPSRDDRHRMVGPSPLYDAGLKRMDSYGPAALTNPSEASKYADGLMMAIAASKALRRRNLAAMEIDKNLTRQADGSYEVRYSKAETKTKEEILAALPGSLTPYIDAWLTSIRRVLLGPRNSAAVWLTINGDDMPASTFYYRFCRATEDELGVRIHPHFVRKIVATGVAVSAPDLVGIVQHLLDHRSDDMRRQAYDLADKLSASRRYIELLEQRRRKALRGLER
jgi:integrase